MIIFSIICTFKVTFLLLFVSFYLEQTYKFLIKHEINPIFQLLMMRFWLITDIFSNVKNSVARLNSGSLAGSVLTMDKAVRNIVDWNISTLEDAIKMATYVPALSCNIDNVCGSIYQGMDADFIVTDNDFNIHETYINGICKYKVNSA